MTKRKLNLSVCLSILPLAFIIAVPATAGFPLCFVHSRIHVKISRGASSRCLARAPPTANFDLEAIEAYEQQLDKMFRTEGEIEDDDLDFGEFDDEAMTSYTVTEDLHNSRIDAVISAFEPKLSRSHCGNLVTDGHVQIVNPAGETQAVNRKSFKVEAGSILRVTHPKEDRPNEIIAENIPLDILFEDEHMIVLNKAADMVVHPAAGNWDGTVVNALAYYLANNSPYGSGDFIGVDGSLNSDAAEGVTVDGTDGEAISTRPGIVHRLDKGTTGVLVVAKTKASLSALSAAFASRSVKKTYLAITVGNPGRRVAIDKPIGRHPMHRQRMRVVPDPHKKNSSGTAPKDRLAAGMSPSQAGRRALSFVDTLAFDGKLSVVQVRIETGRTHQIRVHLQDRHTPIYGDDVYGLSDWNKRLSKTHQITRPLLHAHKLELCHPVTGKNMVFYALMADDMVRVAKAIWPEGGTERPDLFPVDA